MQQRLGRAPDLLVDDVRAGVGVVGDPLRPKITRLLLVTVDRPGLNAGRQTATYSAPRSRWSSGSAPGAGDDALAGLDAQLPTVMVQQHGTGDDQGDLVEGRGLERLGPVGRSLHVGHGDGLAAGVHPADVLVDDLAAGTGMVVGVAISSGTGTP